MPKYITVTEQIERRTYFKGRLTAKFAGTIDEVNSDLRIENFYHIEITEAHLLIERRNFRTWHEEEKEFEEFEAAEKFVSRLPVPIAASVVDEDGSIKNYNLHVFEPKLMNHHLFNQLYDKEQLYISLEGEISGFLRHYDEIEKQVEIEEPESVIIELQPAAVFKSGIKNSSKRTKNAGCAPQTGCAVLPGGCLSLLGIIIIAYLCFAVILMLISAVGQIFAGFGSLIFPYYLTVLFPLFFVGVIFYVFVKLQSGLSFFWKIIFRLFIIMLIFLLWFNH